MINYVSGYWNENLGDDLFLRVLCERYPREQFITFVNPSAEKTLSSLKNLTINILKRNLVTRLANKCEYIFNTYIPFSNRWQIQHQLTRQSNYIEIGGSIFMMPTNRVDGGIEYKNRMKIVGQMDQYHVLGSNFGPYKYDRQLKQYRLFFNSVNSVSFRDKYSYSLFKGNDNAQYAPDIIFQLAVSQLMEVPIVNDQYTVISIIDPRIKVKNRIDIEVKDYYDRIIQNIIADSIRNRQKVILMSFCDNEGDLSYCQETFNMTADAYKKYIKIIPYRSMNESLNILLNSQRIAASRYHAMVLAWLMERPVYVISYSKKVTNVIQDIFPQQSYVDLLDGIQEEDIFFSLLEKKRLDVLIHQSSNHFKILDKLLSH